MNTFLFSFEEEEHCNVSWVLDKHNSLYTVFSTVDIASMLAISKDVASEDVEDDWDKLEFTGNTGVSEVFLVEVDGLKVYSLFLSFIPVLWMDHNCTN